VTVSDGTKIRDDEGSSGGSDGRALEVAEGSGDNCSLADGLIHDGTTSELMVVV
jgi:hypothetical protein